jgi:hypothetical protein
LNQQKKAPAVTGAEWKIIVCPKTTSKHPRRASHPAIPADDPSVSAQPNTANKAAVKYDDSSLKKLAEEPLLELIHGIYLEQNVRACEGESSRKKRLQEAVEQHRDGLEIYSDQGLQNVKVAAEAEANSRGITAVDTRQKNVKEQAKRNSHAMTATAHRAVADYFNSSRNVAGTEIPGEKPARKAASPTNANAGGEIEKPAFSKQQASNTREAFIKSLLKDRGLSIHQWANGAKVDFHTANKYLKGKTNPYPETLKKLADALGIAVADFPA